MAFRVSVSKDYLTFCAAHFLTIPGHKCEALHGHNYVVTLTVEGPVDPRTGFVVDFAVLKRVVRPAIDRWDHRVLVPGRNPHVALRRQGERVEIDIRGTSRFVLPDSNVVTVPVAETTAELLAEHLAAELVAGLGREGIGTPDTVTVDVEESPGQRGRFTLKVSKGEQR
jgi:6-pyruvoyltetrahydropterin/6-carboxytetrahydropterin synthase